MAYKEFNFKGAGGIKLFAQEWTPETGSRALVLITHGHGEHSGRYQHVAQALAARGFAVVAPDLRGHGRSEGSRGFVKSWDDYRQDLDLLIKTEQPEFNGLPIFLYGHSLGGTIALEFVLIETTDIRGVIASAPILGKPNIPEILFMISKILSRIAPGFSMATQLDATSLSRDPMVVQAYRDDPLVHSIGTARAGTELVRIVKWLNQHAMDLRLPILLIHGSQDRLVNPEDSKIYFANVSSQDKTFLELPDGYHEPHNDLDRDIVIQRVGDWIEAHL
jgi:alpha-beta hydrolase superfamily lysophospholipase